MSPSSISSLGQPPQAFSSISKALKANAGAESSAGSSKVDQSQSGLPVSTMLAQGVRQKKRQELRRQGRELVAFRMVDQQTANELAGGSNSPGIKAVMISRDRDSANSFSIDLLRVTDRGQAKEIYSASGLKEIRDLRGKRELDLTGNLLEKVS